MSSVTVNGSSNIRKTFLRVAQIISLPHFLQWFIEKHNHEEKIKLVISSVVVHQLGIYWAQNSSHGVQLSLSAESSVRSGAR